jgi:hypothetical protein
MSTNDTDASYFLATGELHPIREYVEDRLGDEIFLRPEAGHDGKFAFLQAHDLLISDTELYENYMERPVYRLQRQVLPALAAPFLLVGDWGLVWGLLLVQVAAVGVGSWAIAQICSDRGLPAWLGLAFPLNLGVLSSIVAGTADTLAWALASLGIWLYNRQRVGPAVLALMAAALSREAMLIVVAGLVFDAYRRRDRGWFAPLAVPFAAVGLWALFVRVRLGVPVTATQSQELGAPFFGLVDAIGSWVGNGFETGAALGALMVVLLAVFLLLARRSGDVLLRATAGFALLSPFLTAAVWEGFFDSSRAMAPVLTVLLVVLWQRLFAPNARSGSPAPDPVARP